LFRTGIFFQPKENPCSEQGWSISPKDFLPPGKISRFKRGFAALKEDFPIF
jgi:hypothetical protein